MNFDEQEVFTDRQAWNKRCKELGYKIASWGHGSADAIQGEDDIVGTFTSEFDGNSTRPSGWLIAE